eukprot:6184622-Pleurochrysis_carterae.AAC.4
MPIRGVAVRQANASCITVANATSRTRTSAQECGRAYAHVSVQVSGPRRKRSSDSVQPAACSKPGHPLCSSSNVRARASAGACLRAPENDVCVHLLSMLRYAIAHAIAQTFVAVGVRRDMRMAAQRRKKSQQSPCKCVNAHACVRACEYQ